MFRKDFRLLIANCKALSCRLGLCFSLLLIGPFSMLALAHEIRPAVADLSLSHAAGGDGETGASSRLHINIDLNVELFLAGLDASQVSDTDEAPQGAKYDALRHLPAAELAAEFTARWPEFKQSLSGLAGYAADGDFRPLDFQLQTITVEDDPAISLPRSSKLVISAMLDPADKSVRFGWAANLGPLVVRQQDPKKAPETLYTGYLEPGAITAPILTSGTTAQPALTVALDYIKIGFVHIVPKGLDHILFVLGLFFYAARWRPLLGQVTLFTLAHTTTLMLASTGYITVSPEIIEPLIAASIIYIAFENLRSNRLGGGRLAVIFGFGLLHGLGFASVLGDIGLAHSRFILSLISFNIGVELGQLAVVLPAFLLFGVAAGNALWYRRLIAVPASYIIGAIGLLMLVTRVIGG